MSEYVSPVYNVKAIPVEKIRANNYNPNKEVLSTNHCQLTLTLAIRN